MNSLFQSKGIILDKLGFEYDKIIEDQHKLEEVRNSSQPLVALEENEKRLESRMAREPEINEWEGFWQERILAENDLVNISTLKKIISISKSVCRILLNNKAVGTGFLINKNIVMTNNHVIPSADDCRNISVQFYYETDEEDKILNTIQFDLDPDTFFFTSKMKKQSDDEFSGLDFTMVAVEAVNSNNQAITDIPSLELDGNIGKIIKGESCIVIQHPNGLPKKTTLNNNSFFSENNDQIIYETDTLPGSSGSLVLALGTCEIIALHQTGVPKMDEKGNPLTKNGTIATRSTPESEIDWFANAGIRVSRIIEVLKKKNFDNPAHNLKKNDILAKTTKTKKELKDAVSVQPEIPAVIFVSPGTEPKKEEIPAKQVFEPAAAEKPTKKTANSGEKVPFLILAKNTNENFEKLESELRLNFGSNFDLSFAMQHSEQEDQNELYVLNIPTNGKNPNEFARELLGVSEIIHAEYDGELYLNMDDKEEEINKNFESFGNSVDKSSEAYFVDLYGKTSKYVKGKSTEEIRQWNWKAVNYSGGLKNNIGNSVKIVQFDTGYSHHPKNYGFFDLEQDFDFVDNDDNSREDENSNLVNFASYGHGARTGSLIIGNPLGDCENNGNCGLLQQNNVKLIPYRVAKDVIILARQSELARAVDAAIASGAKVITTSMGLPPTMVTYNLAKKVYEKGIIWCCAAGNEVKEVVAPAVHPGTIAVAASNPNDEEWKGSSRGKTVDITAPGMHVYVPKFDKNKSGLFQYGMSYGHGTSYATPHVSSAAVLWLYKNKEKLAGYHGFQIVEAFRSCLQRSARTKHSLPQNFGAGILDIDQLLKEEIPTAKSLKNAYNGEDPSKVEMAFRTVGETLKMLWNGLQRTYRTKFQNEESLASADWEMSDHARRILDQNAVFGTAATESLGSLNDQDALNLYNHFRNEVV